MKATEIAWLAGIIDGEGYIGLVRRSTRGYYDLVVAVGMCHMSTVRRVKRIAKTGRLQAIVDGRGNARDSLRWIARCSQAEQVLRLVYKHLYTKQPQAKLGLMVREKLTAETGHRLDSRSRAQLVQAWAKMRRLNKKGRRS